jgi:hypothetical protein
MPDGVDAAVHGVQPAIPDASRYRVIVEPAGAELAGRDLAVLLRGPSRDEHVGGCVTLLSSSTSRTTHPPRHDAILARRVLRNSTQM